MQKLKFTLVFSALIILSISKGYAQPATKPPFIKYLINNYSSLHKAIDDSSEPVVGKPLQRFRPIPLPLSAAANALPGVDVDFIPGLSAPNFWLGGSPEIKGLVQEVGGTGHSKTTGANELLFFKSGAQGVAVSSSGKIFTSSLTVPPGSGRRDDNPLLVNGFFSFNSTAAILPTFNNRSNETFVKSPEKIFFEGVEIDNDNLEIAYFALHPLNENIVYAAFQNSVTHTKILARKNRAGDWQQLDWDMPGGLAEGVWGALTVDLLGSLYVADADHHVIVKVIIDESDGTAASWQIIAGKMDTPGFENSDEDPQDARFRKPSGICIDVAGNIYIGDAGNNVIRIIERDGDVKTYAGDEDGEAGSSDDGLLSSAKFSGPTAVAYNEITNTLYVVDAINKTIREINKDKKVSTLAGHAISTSPEGIATALYYYLAKLNMNPGEHLFSAPTGIAIDPSGLGLYVSDGKYIKYVNSSESLFKITAAVGDPKANLELADGIIIPVLPLGIKINPSNGSFYGIPLQPWEPTTYTISIYNHVTVKSQAIVPNGVITFEVVDCPEKTDTVFLNKTISFKELPYNWNGKRFDSAAKVTVNGQTRLGCDSVTVLNLSIYPEFNYNSEPYILSLNQQIKPIVPKTAGSIVETFSVAPALPAGLALNALTGEITGTPSAVTSSQSDPAVGPQTAPQYPAPWTLSTLSGADLTGFKISDGNGKTVFENNSGFKSLQGTAGPGTGTAGAYTDFSGLGPIKMFSNNPYSVQLSNTLSGGNSYSLNDLVPSHNYMNSYAVYIDYNRNGNFADAGERVYISAGPQREAHAEAFNLNIPASAKAGVTKMRIYAVEAWTRLQGYQFYDANRPGSAADKYYWVYRTTEQALSFYPFFNDISMRGEMDFNFINYGEFEDYNINIVTPVTQSYVVTGSNVVGSAQSTIKLAVSQPTYSSTNLTICDNQLPYKWNNITFDGAGTKTDTLRNVMYADSLATLNLTVNQRSSSAVEVAHCGPYTYHGQVYTESGWYYGITIPNAAGCDSIITLKFRQKATASTTSLVKTPNELPFTWNGKEIRTAGTYTYTQPNKELCDSIATLILVVRYNITYATNNLLTLNKTISPISPQIQGGYVPPGVWYNEYYGYSISPALPPGLQLDPVTGIISGTPTALSPLKTYTITLNQEGAQPTTVTLSVGAPSFSTTTIDNCGPLTWNGVEYDKAGTYIANLKNQYGYDSTATLVLSIRNLSASTTDLNLTLAQIPFTWNDTSIATEGLHTVHLKNAVDCDSATTANVVISPKILYASPKILLHNQAISAIAPQNLGGKVLNYTITPSLVPGLQFDASTGIITGTPADTLIQPVTYTITAFNRAGNYSTELVVAVCNSMATSFAEDVCNSFVWNDSTYTESTTHTRTFKNRGGCDSTSTMNLIIRKATKGITETVTACSSYTWYEVKYDTSGIYTKVFQNAVGCDSTLTLKLTVNYPSLSNLYVNLNASDFPYTWRDKKTFTAPGTDTVFLRNGNSLGCDSTVRMTVSISAMLPDITYAVTDTVLHWEQSITTPIAMSNTGTAIPAMKLGESDTLIKFANAGPGDHIRNTVKGRDGAYYSRVHNNSTVFKLSPSGVWSPFVNAGRAIKGLAIDTSGNMYVAFESYLGPIKKITPDGTITDLPGSPRASNPDNVFVDENNNLFILESSNYTQLDIVKFNLSTGKEVKMKLDNSPYFQFGPEDMKVDSKGNIYIYRNSNNVLVKIRPDGRMSSIGRKGSDYSVFKPGNGPDATLPNISSIAIDPTNDNLYIMAGQQLLRVDTAENVTAISGKSFDYWYQIFRVEGGKVYVINNQKSRLFTSNIYGVGSLPFMDNYGASGVNNGTVNYTDFDKRIRLDSSGSIVGTPRSTYASPGYRYGSNSSIGYTIIAANEHGISKAPMGIITKGITYKRESFITTTLPFTWRGRSFTAATDTATHYVKNRLEVDDTLYLLHLVYEGPPEPLITTNCVTGGVLLAANGAAKSAISFDGNKMGIIKNTERNIEGGQLGFYNVEVIKQPDNSELVKFHSSFEVWIKPASVSGTQYLLTRDTVKTHGTFFGYSIQDGKFVYEFTQSGTTGVEYTLSSAAIIKENEWTHVAASFYDSTMFIFINGKLEGSQKTGDRFTNLSYSESPGSSVSIWPDFFLGGLPGKNGYKGEMDELRLWGKRRNADSVKATMNTIVDPSSFRLGLYYRFDGDLSGGVPDVSLSGRTATFVKPATSVASSGAPINFASHKWMPGGETTPSIVVKPTSTTLYSVTVKDYKETMRSASLSVQPIQGPSITAPLALVKNNDGLSCGVVVSDANLGTAIATDNCPGVVVTITGVPAGNLFPVGETIITYTATNLSGLTKSATQTVTIKDISKPVFSTTLSAPSVLWPPDHKMKSVALTYVTSDLCGTVTNKVTVTSTDPISGASDGDISPDWVITNDHLVQLRAERGNGKEARVYTITVTPIDQYGNEGLPQSTNVTIAHNITGPITGNSFKIGSTVDFSGVFWDKQGNKHTGEWVIDDNTIVKGTVTEPSASKNGKLTGSYKFTAAGIYKLRMNITDQNRLTSYCTTNEDMEAIVVIYDPNGGFTYGGGWFASPAGALKSDAAATGKANFGYSVNYFKGAANPKGETQFELKVGDFEYNALNFDYLSVAGAKAQIKGTGKITGGQSGINFIMTVIDGALDNTGIDKIRIKVYNKNTGQVYYDNEQGSDANNPVTKVGTNSQIVIGGTSVNTGGSTPVARLATLVPTDDLKLEVQAFPNPSHGLFSLLVRGKNNEPVSVRVTDVMGRLVEVRKGLSANGTFTLGASYRPGLYIAEVLQGKEKVVLKLIKQSE